MRGRGDGVSAPGSRGATSSTVWTLRLETARVRNLSAECREAGIDYAGLPVELQDIRALVEERRYDEALLQMRELKVELLARLLLEERQALPPAEIENPPAPAIPPSRVQNAPVAPKPRAPR